jgi:thioesterase domain-containing protein
MKRVTDILDPKIKLAHETHKSLTTMKKEELKPLEEIESKINKAFKDYDVKKQEEARLLQEKINKDLAEQAEALRQKQLKEAENASEWEQEIVKESVAEIKPVAVSIEDCKSTVIQKIDGQHKRSCWRARIINPDLIPKEYWIINESLLDKKAKELKDKFDIPGCESWDDYTFVTKGL